MQKLHPDLIIDVLLVFLFVFYIKTMATINGLNKKSSQVLKIQRINRINDGIDVCGGAVLYKTSLPSSLRLEAIVEEEMGNVCEP